MVLHGICYGITWYFFVLHVLYFLRLHCMVLHCIALHRIAWHCIAFDYLFIYCMVFVMVLHGILLFCMVLHRLHGVVQLIWRAGELQRSASSHFTGSSGAFSIQCPFKVGWSAIFGLNFCLIFANLLYIAFAVVDKKKPVQDGTSGDYSAESAKLVRKNA